MRDRNGGQVTLGLDNLRNRCNARPDECDGATAALVASLGEAVRDLAAAKTPGRLLAAAPARHVVLFTGSANLNDVATLMSAAKDLAAHEHHPISPTVLEFTGEGWRVPKKLL